MSSNQANLSELLMQVSKASGVPADGSKKAASVQNTPKPLDFTGAPRSLNFN
jgi:hypothetical protein